MDPEDAIEYRVLSTRRRTSRKGTAWCGTRREGHFIPPGVRYREEVAIVEGEFEVWRMCESCEGDLMGYDMPNMPKLHPHPAVDWKERRWLSGD